MIALVGVVGALTLTAVSVVTPVTSATGAGFVDERPTTIDTTNIAANNVNPRNNANNAAAPLSGNVTINLANLAFSPANMTVTTGTMVTWVNQDQVAHTVTSGTRGAANGLFDAALRTTGSTFSFVFTNVGTFRYFCQPHANMNAQITVVAANANNGGAAGAGTGGAGGGTANGNGGDNTASGTANGTAGGTGATTPTTSVDLLNPKRDNPAVTAPVRGSASAGTTPRQQDIDLIKAVRTADLWEATAGQQAMTKASDQRVKDIGNHIQEEHIELDLLVRDLGTKLGIDLPTAPNSDQMFWLNELSNSQGQQFDQIFVSRLRFAHGGVFQKIAEVRVNTPNDDVRQFAIAANVIVARHLAYLESTNLVDFSNTQAPASAKFNNSKLTKIPASASDGRGGQQTVILVFAVGIVLALLIFFLYRGTRS